MSQTLQNGEWGWEINVFEEDKSSQNHGVQVNNSVTQENVVGNLSGANADADERQPPGQSDQWSVYFLSKNLAAKESMSKVQSSSSFHDLDKAIAMSRANQDQDNVNDYQSYKPLTPVSSIIRLSASLNLGTSAEEEQQQRFESFTKENHFPLPIPQAAPVALTNENYVNNDMLLLQEQEQRQQLSSDMISPVTEELKSFILESESRYLMLFHPPNISRQSIKTTCSKYGVLYYLRSEFHDKGVTFISYFDLRAAMYCREVLQNDLLNLLEINNGINLSVHYSVSLHSTNNNFDESNLVVENLSNANNEMLEAIFSRYGDIQSIQKTYGTNHKMPKDMKLEVESKGGDASNTQLFTYKLQYYDVQDANLAASELGASSSRIWGPDIVVRQGKLDPRIADLRQQLLSILARWRSRDIKEMSSFNAGQLNSEKMKNGSHSYQQVQQQARSGNYHSAPPNVSMVKNVDYGFHQKTMEDYNIDGGLTFHNTIPNQSIGVDTTDSRLSPDFQIANQPVRNNQDNRSIYNNNSKVSNPSTKIPPHHHHHHHNYHNNNYLSNHNFNNNNLYRNGSYIAPQQQQQQQQQQSGALQNKPTHHGAPNCHQRSNGNSNGSKYANHSTDNNNYNVSHNGDDSSSNQQNTSNGTTDNAVFKLDLKKIDAEKEMRTTIMVRNIPNKYSQQMLLDEVNAYHEGSYDFFYLPIDFKNRCNVGYCFINFLDSKYIPPFVKNFDGHRWKSFNSEKICAVSFARIQGKNAMISRFQNSSLLEKDDAYQPLLFYSDGPDIGKPEPFPMTTKNNRHGNMSHNHSPHTSPSMNNHKTFANQNQYQSDRQIHPNSAQVPVQNYHQYQQRY